VADRLDCHDADMAASGDGFALAGAVALHFGAGAFDAQIFGGKLRLKAIIEDDLQPLLGAAEADFNGGGHDVA
jgi:hypothetical protein